MILKLLFFTFSSSKPVFDQDMTVIKYEIIFCTCLWKGSSSRL